MSEEVIISKSTIDAGTVSNPNDMIFSSKYNTFKYYLTGSVNLSLTNNTTHWGTTSIAHSLGYKPFFYIMGRKTQDAAGIYYILPNFLGLTGAMTAYTDNNNLYFSAQISSSDPGTVTYSFFYKIFKNNTGF